jgi:predicted flap endonuclease-1-like 5' DNA nuclease
MSYAIMDLHGIGPKMAARLRSAGIRTTAKLLEIAASAKGRKALAAKIGVDEKTILRWANLADRMRIKGIGEDYAKLLQEVGVDTVKELKHRNVAKLAAAMRKANKKKRVVQVLPSEKRITRWVAQARALPEAVPYDSELSLAVAGSGGMQQSFGKSRGKGALVAFEETVSSDTEHHETSRLSYNLKRSAKGNVKTVDRIGRLTALANQTFGSTEFAQKWMRLENPALKGRIPIEIAQTDSGAQEVEAVLDRFAYGDYS